MQWDQGHGRTLRDLQEGSGSLWRRLSKIRVQDQALGDTEASGILEAANRQPSGEV